MATALAGCVLTMAACAGHPVETSQRAQSLSLRAGIVARKAPAMLSCHGDGFCRETASLLGTAEATDELTTDCTRVGGQSRTGGCSHHDVVATCSIDSGEHGPIVVFAYAQSDPERQHRNVETMSELCEQVDGTFELAKR